MVINLRSIIIVFDSESDDKGFHIVNIVQGQGPPVVMPIISVASGCLEKNLTEAVSLHLFPIDDSKRCALWNRFNRTKLVHQHKFQNCHVII